MISGTGCGPGAAAETVRPKEATAATALDESDTVVCRDVTSGAEPLIVDWKPEQRGNLEIAMKDGVAVVAYSCDGIKLLDACKLDGEYGFVGMTRREQVVRLNSSDEVRANLPLSGATIGGEMARESALDIAMILVGKRRTTWSEPNASDLKGECKGATHYVKGAMVGAFALETGTSAKVRAAAEIFAASAGTASSSSKQVRQREGNPDECAQASPDAEKPPAQCGAPLRLVLSPIAAAPAGDAPAPPAPAAAASEPAPCPEGLVYAEGKCTAKTKVSAYECKASDVADCKAQCEKGNAASCGWLGLSEAKSDPTAASAHLDKACGADMAVACVALGELRA
ncbi:MAG TPA: hypothetical protein VM686_25050, partial [Polyangiaceae bacterium]|nr:hypothetical protein [Polyangiaceae bacterium]